MTFVLITNIIFRPIEKINSIIESYPKGHAGFKRFLALLDTEPVIVDRPDAKPLEAAKGNIEYRGVRFSFDDERPVLDGIDMCILAGEPIEFVGHYGAGRTTLSSLRLRFFAVQGC